MKPRYFLFLIAAISGCATTTHGPKQRIMVSTPGAPNAECTLTSPGSAKLHFTTPEAIEITRYSEAVEVRCHKKCFYDGVTVFSPVINNEDLASNGFFGGAGPLAVDLATKRYYNYNYDFVINLKPDRRCRSRARGFLDGNPGDFDTRIDDFSFDEGLKSVPEADQKQTESKPAQVTPEKVK